MDTGAWIALLLQNDPHHAEATRFFQSQPSPRWLVTSTVLAETYTWLRYHANDPALCLIFMERSIAAEESGQLEVIRPDLDLERRAASLARRFADVDLSWTDLISMAACQQRGTREVFGFDRHFHIAGLVLMPESH